VGGFAAHAFNTSKHRGALTVAGRVDGTAVHPTLVQYLSEYVSDYATFCSSKNCSSSVEPCKAVVELWPCWIAWVTASK